MRIELKTPYFNASLVNWAKLQHEAGYLIYLDDYKMTDKAAYYAVGMFSSAWDSTKIMLVGHSFFEEEIRPHIEMDANVR